MQMPWALKLHDVLANMTFLDQGKSGFQQTRKQVTVVFGDVNYASSLFNWLVSALVVTSPPLRNIVVVSLDEELQALLDRKDITSVHVNPEAITSGQIKRKVSQIWITRCVVYRLLNYWGYDVMAYDTDAIVLRNLQDVLDMFGESDVIGSAGGYPFNLGAMWGQTLCMGVVFFKSTRKTGRCQHYNTCLVCLFKCILCTHNHGLYCVDYCMSSHVECLLSACKHTCLHGATWIFDFLPRGIPCCDNVMVVLPRVLYTLGTTTTMTCITAPLSLT